MKKLKINLHITQKCNYHCRYCFAQFREKQDLPVEEWKRVIDNLEASGLVDRINFAGGEPVLYRGFPELVDYAFQKGFRLSVISNGSLMLDPKMVPEGFFRKIEMLGISVDSINPGTLQKLGCIDPQGRVLDEVRLCRLITKAKDENPAIRIKLNTVVTDVNKDENMRTLGSLPIDRWKFLKMKPFEEGDFSNKDLAISDSAFENFLMQNPVRQGDAVPEYSLTRSYIIVDNRGNLIDNQGDTYTVVGNLLDEDFATAFQRYPFDEDAYDSRYTETQAG